MTSYSAVLTTSRIKHTLRAVAIFHMLPTQKKAGSVSNTSTEVPSSNFSWDIYCCDWVYS
jgi:hypothetical protein